MLSSIVRQQLRCRHTAVIARSFVKLGDKVPISYVKDSPDPVILKDEEYPDWVMRLHEPLPTKRQMLEIIDNEGIDSLTEQQIKRTKRLITKEVIKQNNMQSLT